MNNRKKLFIISDIHGFYTEMKAALDNAGFCENDDGHLLICCGDYFDRGKENRKVFEYLEKVNNKILIRGNHEDVLSYILESGLFHPKIYISNASETLKEFFGEDCLDEKEETVSFSADPDVRQRLLCHIRSCVNYYETEKYIFTHGWLPFEENDGKLFILKNPSSASDEQWHIARKTKWTDAYNLSDRPSKTLVCGHYPTFYANTVDSRRKGDDSSVYCGKGLIAIDAGTDTSKRVNVLVLKDSIL
ncbi:MAG: metallophosphoesterase [Clostridia bacterium]|nr:metallophosphoesterase [Clostridia bacterium]